MNIKVNVEVKMESGAVINLTDPQAHQVAKYIEDVVFGRQEVVKEKRKYVTKKNNRRWTPAEVEAVRAIMNLPKGREKNKAAKKLSFELKRTRAAISQMGVDLRKKSRQNLATNGGGHYMPLNALAAGYLGK